jgi:hypothetical protein
MRAEPPCLAVGGCALERQRGVLLECGHRRLEEHEDLGSALERELLDACGNRAESSDQRGAPRATVARISE